MLIAIAKETCKTWNDIDQLKTDLVLKQTDLEKNDIFFFEERTWRCTKINDHTFKAVRLVDPTPFSPFGRFIGRYAEEDIRMTIRW